MPTGIGVGIAGQVFQSKAGSGVAPEPYDNRFSVDFNGVDESMRSSTLSGPDFGTADFSISFWLKPDEDRSGNERIMHKVGGVSWQIFITGSDTMQWVGGWNDGALFSLDIDSWQHIVYSVDRSGNASWYKNATFSDSKDISSETSNYDAGNNFFVGRNGGGAYNYHGQMDEIAFYKKALSSSEITAIYNSGNSADLNALSSASDLSHWFRMGDPNGDSLFPQIPNSSDNSGSDTFALDFFENMQRSNIVQDAP